MYTGSYSNIEMIATIIDIHTVILVDYLDKIYRV